jgi:signal recognition particle subunit SRP19
MVSKGLDRFVLWPCYFDARLSRGEGRRVAAKLAVRDPDAPWIESAAKKLQLDPQLEESAKHPSIPYEKMGRVLVKKKGSKEQVLELVAQRMRESQEERVHEQRR